MQGRIVRCPDCGKLYAEKPGKTRCAACTAARLEASLRVEDAMNGLHDNSPERIAKETGLSVGEVIQIIEDSPFLRHLAAVPRTCAKCGKAPADRGSRYCLDCRLILHKTLVTATEQIIDDMRSGRVAPGAIHEAVPAGEDAHARTVAETVRRKRNTSPLSRHDPTPRGRYSGG